jgi:hypothetical protein
MLTTTVLDATFLSFFWQKSSGILPITGHGGTLPLFHGHQGGDLGCPILDPLRTLGAKAPWHS